jgi:hypothetical protein
MSLIINEAFSLRVGMVKCPECGNPLRKESEGKDKYFCENDQCNIAFVLHPHEPNRTRIVYTGFMRYKTVGLPHSEPRRQSLRQKFKLL